jgi:glutaredoxin
MLTLYSKNNCSFCVKAKYLLTQHGIAFEEIKIDEIPETREFIMAQGHRTVPQIYHNGKLFVEGGFQGLSTLSSEDIQTKMDSNNNITLGTS